MRERNSVRGLASIVHAAMLCLLAGSAAWAGPNEGGTLVLHSNPSLAYCVDTPDYCGQSGLSSCGQAITQVPIATSIVFFALAAFPADSSPRMSGIHFGIEYDASRVTLLAWRTCADFELASSNWPDPSGHSAMTWNEPQTAHLTEVYWFAGYSYDATTLSVAPSTVDGGHFGDDSIPSIIDQIAGYGSLGFDQPGTRACPNSGGGMGACCDPCNCTILSADECAAQGGIYLGDGTSCDPSPCECPPPLGACCIGCECVVTTEGDCLGQGGVFFGPDSNCSQPICGEGPPIACCLSDGTCLITTPCGCTQIGGVWDGESMSCEPNPCQPVAIDKGSWGRMKSHYR